KDVKITAIVTSPYIRCMHTAQIINKYHNVPIIEDERFNETDYYNKETFEKYTKLLYDEACLISGKGLDNALEHSNLVCELMM
ncbi:MAG: histidine phosphatase family protein, partial [Clostridia bacterium]|nr:histidine phosphatase family protein [Clostridia bacterium]